jgi:uracil-DNA glycosylase family 4
MDQKKNATCKACPMYNQTMYTPRETGSCDIWILGEYPTPKESRYGFYMESKYRVILNIVKQHQKKNKVRLDFAIGCPPINKPKTEDYDRCKHRLHKTITEDKPKVVVCLGINAARTLGIKGMISKSRGILLSHEIEGHRFNVIVTHSTGTLYKRPGLADIIQKDVNKALKICRYGDIDTAYEIEVCKDYQTTLQAIQEAQDAADKSEGKLLISFDTETNSLEPYSSTGKVIAVSLSWKTDHGVAFLLDHKEAQHSEQEIQSILQALEKLLSSEKVFLCAANAKFDFQWLRHRYGLEFPFPDGDVLLMEHTIAEDKRGEYGLKQLTKDYIPDLGGYDDALDQELEKVRQDLIKKHTRRIKQTQNEHTEQWLNLTDNERKTMLEAWVKQGHLPASDIDELYQVKHIKKRGSRLPAPSYIKKISATIKKIPGHPVNSMCLQTPRKPTYEDVHTDQLLWYAAMDALVTRKIFAEQYRILKERQANMKKICTDSSIFLYDAITTTTLPLSEIIAEMEYNGARFNREKAQQNISLIDTHLAQLKESLYSAAGRNFNTSSSSKNLEKILFKDKGYISSNTTKSGRPSTDKETLKALYEKHQDPFLKGIIEYREAEKIRNTYIKNWLNLSEADGRVHFSLNQHGTATHRLSCDRGLQNAPARLESLDLNIKEHFIPDTENHEFYDLDIANAEMRVLCAYSRDEALIDAFNNDKDFHSLTAAGISDLSYEEILAGKSDKDSEAYKLRQLGKKINFGTVYSMGPETLKKQLWTENRIFITLNEAQEYLDKFFKTYPGVAAYIKETEAFAVKYRFVYTFTGRVRRFPLIGNDPYQKSRALRQAVNARIQTTSADIVNTNLTDLSNALQSMGGRVVLTVHDSILFQLPKGTPDVKALLDRIIVDKTREKFPWLPVKWKYDVGRGPSYGECEKF